MTIVEKLPAVSFFFWLISFNSCGQNQMCDIRNLSFDYQIVLNDLNYGWDFSGCSSGGAVRDTVQVKAGAASARISVTSCRRGEGSHHFFQKITIPAGVNEIDLSFWTKSESLTRGCFKIAVLDGQENLVVMKEILLKHNREWAKVSLHQKNKAGRVLYLEFEVGDHSLLWLDDLEIRFDGKDYCDIMKRDEKGSKEITDYLRSSNIVPLSSDLSKILSDVDSKKIIGIGESSHGSHEIVDFRNHLVRELILKENCRLIILEAPEIFGERLNQYVQGRSGKAITLRDIQKRVQFYNVSEELVELVEWIRFYNDTTEQKVAVAGMDVSSEWYDVLRNSIYKARSNPYIKTFNRYYMMSQSDSMLYFLDWNRQAMISSLGQPYFDSLLHIASRFDQFISVTASRFNNELRDSIMAENVINLVNRHTKVSEKAVVYGHLSHLNKQALDNMLVPSVGSHLYNHFGDSYFVLGLLVGKGSYQADQFVQSEPSVYELALAPSGSMEYSLTPLSLEPFYLNVSEVPVFNQVMSYRMIGGVPKHNQFFPGNPSKRFDAVAYFPEGTPLHLLFSLYKEAFNNLKK